nr:integrase, catalytic region, zinc finger, CCHC-type, peptidase aspartic, catalytic [Tanacetum cinerariifolium]
MLTEIVSLQASSEKEVPMQPYTPRCIQNFCKVKDHDINFYCSNDIKPKIKILDHKHAEGSSKNSQDNKTTLLVLVLAFFQPIDDQHQSLHVYHPMFQSRLKQGESINVQDLETSLYWEFGKFTSREGESLESYYSRFYKMMNKLVRNQCDVTNHQHQNEVNEIRAERLARTANPLAYVAQQQPAYLPQNHPIHYTHNSSTRSQQAATRNRGKAIVNSSPPIYDQEPSMVAEDDEMLKDKEIDNIMALISLSFKKIYKPTNNNLRTSSNTNKANQDNSLRINRGTGYDNQRIVNVVGARENVEVTPNAADNSGPIFDSEPLQKVSNNDNYNVFAIESEHPEQSKSVNDTYPIEQDEHNVIIDSLDISYDREHVDQDDDDDLANERDLLASLIEKLKCEIDDNKNHNKFLETSNKVLVDKLKAPESDEVIRLEKESRSKLSDLIKPFDYEMLNNLYDLFVPQREKSSAQRYFSEWSKMSHTSVNNENSKETFNKQTTLLEKWMDESIPWDQKCKSSKELFKIKKGVDTVFDGVERCKQTIAKKIYFGHIDPFIQNTIEGNFCSEIRRINADLEKFLLCLKEEMVADLRYFNSLELEVDSLKSQLETQKILFLNEIDRLSREYYYADHMNAVLGVYTELDEVTNLQCDYLETLEKCECLEKELSKSKMMSTSFEALQKHAINLELDLQQCKEKIKNDKSFKKNQSKEFLKEHEQYFEIQDLKAQLQDKGIAISELKKLIEKLKGKSVESKFEKSSVIRQPNAFKSQRPSILGKPTIFLDSLKKQDCSKSKSVTKNNVSNAFSKPVTAQILPPTNKSIIKNTNVIAPGMYKLHIEPIQTRIIQLPHDIRKTNKRVSFSTRVISYTSVSRPQLKSNQMEDRVMLNNSQGKKQEVEDHRRNVKLSNNKTSITACNDSLNAKTSNTKMPMDVPISTRESKRIVNQSVATPLRRTVASESTNQKPRHTTRKLYEHVTKTCSWWYPKFTPPGYKWKPKSQIGNVNPNLVEIILFIVNSGCSKHMTGNLKLLTNFVEKFLGSVKFGNDQIAPIIRYGDLVQGTVTIKRVYYVERLNHNLFSVGQFCDADLEVAFRKSTCYIRDLKGNDLLTDYLCSSCELRKAKRKSFQTKTTLSSKRRLQLLHMDLCGRMRVESINGKKYVLVIVDDYSRYTWTHFLRSKDETPEVLIDFLRLVQRGLHTQLVEIVLFIVDAGCSKHMTGNLKLLINFVEKFLGMVKFGNDQIAPILGYGDLVQGAITIKRVYYVEGLNHNLFSVGQFCNADLKVAFRKSTCYIRDLKGNDLLIGSRGMDLYSITLQDTNCPNPICLMAKASSSQAWLWHRRLSHFNFDTINLLSKNDIVVSNSEVKDNKIDILVQQNEQFFIFEDEYLDSAFARFNTIITSLKALDEGYSSKNYFRKFLRALHPKWREKVMEIKESKDLTSLSLNELIRNLKVHEMTIKKDFEIVKAKGERKSLALKAKKESSDEESLTFGSKDKEYAMAVRDFKKFFKRRGRECSKPHKDKNQRGFVECSWSDSGEEDDEKAKDEMCLVAQASSKYILTPLTLVIKTRQ